MTSFVTQQLRYKTTRLALAFALVTLIFLHPRRSLAQYTPDAGNAPYEWDHVFPLFGKALADKGIVFPLPWGVGLNYVYANQAISIPEISIAANESDYVDITDLIEFGDIRSRVHATNLRLDLWVLPFLNIYALGNYLPSSTTSVEIEAPFQFEAQGVQDGGGGGFGATAAFGFHGFFGTLDMNWAWSKMRNLSTPVSTFLLTPRVGRNFGKVGPIRLAVWTGAMRQAVGSKTEGSISLKDAVDEPGDAFAQKILDWYNGLSPVQQALVNRVVDEIDTDRDVVIHYRLKKQLQNRWNMTLGTEVGFTDNLFLRAEVGFIGRTQVVCGLNYRFGGLY